MILVDTSVWIDFIRTGHDEHLDYLLEGEGVAMHDFVIGEIAMGSLKNRKARLAMLKDLHRIPTAEDHEVITLIESAKLFSLGLTYIDAHLLTAAVASSDLSPVRLWTGDMDLRKQAERFGVAYNPA
jgi:predicted nucleic acid-binding protein